MRARCCCCNPDRPTVDADPTARVLIDQGGNASDRITVTESTTAARTLLVRNVSAMPGFVGCRCDIARWGSLDCAQYWHTRR